MQSVESEKEYLQSLIELEDLAEKKANIYARLLIEPSLASQMEELASRHKERRRALETLLYGEPKKAKAEGKE